MTRFNPHERPEPREQDLPDKPTIGDLPDEDGVPAPADDELIDVPDEDYVSVDQARADVTIDSDEQDGQPERL